jgi:glycerate 2-kinase
MTRFAAALYERAGQVGERRRQIVQIMDAALDAVDPAQAVAAHLRREGNMLWVGERAYDLDAFRRVIVVGAGKAGAPMAQAVEAVLGDRITAGTVNVKYGYTLPTGHVQLCEAGHPIPDEPGRQGAQRIAALLSEAGAEDLVLCLISGGGSALMTLPSAPITLAEMQALTDALLRAGATINEINTVRKHLETIKGGGLARLAYPAQVASLILSDVVGNPLDVIASGPTVPDTTTYADAQGVLARYGLLAAAPASIRARLEAGRAGAIADTPKPGDALFERAHNVIVASNDIAARAALREAERLGYRTLLLSTFVEGEAREVAKVLVGIAREIHQSGSPVAAPACVVVGGETTVTVRGQGLGGRNQEMALMAALRLEGLPDVALACLATDGTDGPTDASGALADGDTMARARALGLDAWDHLERNDSYRFFEPLDDLLVTGPTNTNVNDLALLFVW